MIFYILIEKQLDRKTMSNTEEIVSLDEETTRMIKLISSDDQVFEIDAKSASLSKLVATAVDSDDTAVDIAVPSVKADTLAHIVEYLKHHKGTVPQAIAKPLRFKSMSDVCGYDTWDGAFIDTIGEDRQQLYEVILAANYMDIHSLLHLGCAKIASLIKGEPLDKIRDILSPKTDLPSEPASKK
jgi:S-phase kinase-associated protein 1